MQEGRSHNYFRSEDEYDLIDVYELFGFYNTYFFHGVLEKCTVEWSERMTLCAGTCAQQYHQSCVIKLSAPLLKYRTANEIKQTLLHQMIHAYLFLTNPRACLTQGGHGDEFKNIMQSINVQTGLNITVYHNFNDQVNLYRKHIWRCDGPCQTRPPFYGYVKRAMNRKPQPADKWFNQHQRTCGGVFVKISGPEEATKRNSKDKKRNSKEKGMWGKGKTIDEYFKEMSKAKEQKKGVKKGGKNIVEYMKEMNDKKSKQNSFSGTAKTIGDYCREMQQQNRMNNPNQYEK